MGKIKVELTIYVENEEVDTKDILSDMVIVEDDVVDGFVITRSGRIGSITDEFYLNDVMLESAEIVDDEK